MKIVIGCDHGGLDHKNAIAEHLKDCLRKNYKRRL